MSLTVKLSVKTKFRRLKKFILKTDGFMGFTLTKQAGGGIIYYKNGKYAWVQQD